MKKMMLLLFCLMASVMDTKAQMGYQISLLNTATGEARANETVTVSVSLSNSEGTIFYSETKSATTNDFGVLSLSIGNADTFKNVDLTKMPFFIEVTANGVMIGKSQMLSVPVAEVAKRVAPIKQEDIVGVWHAAGPYGSTETLTFSSDWTVTFHYSYKEGEEGGEGGKYFIQGNIICYSLLDEDGSFYSYWGIYENGKLYSPSGVYSK